MSTNTHWTLERYQRAKWFDDMVNERVEGAEYRAHKFGKSTEEARSSVLAEIREHWPHDFRAWVAWKNQCSARTIQIPVEWCDVCEGSHLVVRTDEDGENYAAPCMACAGRRRATEN